MSRSARYTGPFGDGPHDFQLNIAELEELQEKCDAGPEEIFHRISEGRWRVADIRETIRLGLKGAGMVALTARAMVDRYAGPGQLADNKELATCILAAALVGAPDEDVPSGEMQGETESPSPDENSGSQTSTKSAAPSATRRRKSARAASGS